MSVGEKNLQNLKLRAARLEGLLREMFRKEGLPSGLEQHSEIPYESALLLQELGDAVPTPIFIKNLDGVFTYCNLALENMLVRKRAQVVGYRLEDIFPRDLASSIQERNANLLEEGLIQVEEQILPRGDGGEVEVQIHRSLLRDKCGQVIGVVGTMTDLGPQRLAQRAQESSEIRYRSLFENALDAIFLMEGARFVDCNPAATRMYGLPTEKLVGCNPVDVSPEFQPDGVASKDKALNMIHSALTGERQYFEWTHCRADGSPFDAEVSLSPLVLDGRDYVLAMVRDITERKRVAAALEASEEFSRGIIQNAPMGVMYTDLEGTIVYENQVLEALMGVPEGEHSKVIGRRLRDLPGLSAFPLDQILQRVASGEAVRNLSVEYTSVYGKQLQLHVHIAPHKSSEDRVVGGIFMIQDITEVKRLEEQLHHAQKMDALGNLAGGIAHDFNNLLTGISGNAEMALQHLDDHARTGDALKELIEISERASQLTRRLLSFSRRQEHNPRPVLLVRLIEDLRKMLRRLIGEQIEISFQCEGEAWAVQVDPGQMEQVIVNLAVNARDAMPDGGSLRIIVENVELDESRAAELKLEAGKHIMLAVEDNGQGIPQDYIDNIFEPFFTTKESGKGTGLGLSIVYGAIKQCRGHIRVESKEGEGSRFEIHLPSLGPVELKKIQGPGSRELHRALDGEKILVIEDEAAVRELTVRCLEFCGYEVLSAENGQDALNLAEELEDCVDLVLSDVIMPGMSGPVAVTRLRERWPKLNVLFCSGYTDGELKRHKLSPQDGAKLLNKPYSLEELSLRIREMLDNPPA